ncbi:hypothetical protein BDR22DRAFT_960427 [Usnea florida]
MSEEHEPSYYVNEGVDSFESGLWDGPGADEYDPYTRFDVNFDFEAAFGLTTSDSAGLEVPDQTAANIEQTQEACGAEKEKDIPESEAFPRSTLHQPYSETENEAPADSLDRSPDPVRCLGHMGQLPTSRTSTGDSGYDEIESQEQDIVQSTSSISGPAWPGHTQYLSSDIEEHSSADEDQNTQGNSGQEQFQPNLSLGNQNFGQNASAWEFPIDDFFGLIYTNAESQQQPDLNTTQRPLVIGEEKDDDPNDSDRDGEDDEDGDEEYSEEDDPPSQVISVTYPVNDPLIVEDPIQKGWGRTGIRNGSEVWFNPKTYKWQPSASHHDMRETLIRRAQQEYPDDKYRKTVHPDKTDGLPHGETAFFKPHQTRGPDREDCPDALFVWRDWKTPDDKTIYKGGHPGYMYEGNKILLDPHNNPVVNHKFIPLTLSAMTHASKLQEMALHPGCKQGDLWARMPRWERKKDKNNNFITIPLRGKNTRINMPMVRFREKKGTVAGENREGTKSIIEGLTAFYLHHGFDPELTGSTKDFGRDLKGWEIKQVRLGNAGQFGKRAGPRALDEETKADNQKKLENAIRNGQEEDATGTRRKRKRPAQDQDDANGDSQAANKRAKKSIRAQSGGSSKQSREKRPSASNTQSYGTYGAPQPHLQNMSPMGGYPQLQTQIPNTPYPEGQYQSLYPSTGRELASGVNQPQRTPNGSIRAQYGRDQAGTGQSFPAQPYVPQHMVRRNTDYEPVRAYGGLVRPQNFGQQELQTPTSEDDIEENRRLRLRHEISGERNQPISRADMSHVPEIGTNTLGPGGRSVHQMPKQVLGKRRQPDAEDVHVDEDVQSYNPTVATISQQDQSKLPTNQVPAAESQQKRRRTNEDQVTVPEPQHRRQNVQDVRSRGPKPCGPCGAPQPILPPGEVLRSTQTGLDGNAQDPYISPEDVDRMLEGIFNYPTSENPNEASAHPAPSQTSAKETAPGNQIIPDLHSPQIQPSTGTVLPSSPPTPQAINLQQPDLLNAPTPALFDQTAPSDIRDVRPTTEAQSRSLQNALGGTRYIYTEWTKEEAPPTDLWKSYHEQYQEIRAAFHGWWRSQGRPEPVPGLWYLQEPWEGGIEDWPAQQ